MKKSMKILGLLTWSLALLFAVSCSEDDANLDDKIDDIINNGPKLEAGYYIVGSAVSADTTSANKLVQGNVNGADFGSQERAGFYEAYVYMGSGSFSFVKSDGEDVTVFGGAHTMSYEGDPDSVQVYIGPFTEDGAEATSPGEGLMHVSIDETTGQYVVIPVNYWEAIGGATETGWSSGQKIDLKSASADEVVFEGTGITLRSGDLKLRFNGNWSMPLEADENCDVNTTACYNYFTNFGGSIDALVHGGGNIVFGGDDGVYTITLTYKPSEGFGISAKLVRTGDAIEITFDPSEYAFGIIGDATAGAWDSDRNMFYKGLVDGSHTWLGVITLAETGNLKFRINDAWDFNLGGTLVADGSVSTLAVNGSDVPSPGAGAYYITLKTADEGTTWTATMINKGWGIIGAATATGWDSDTQMTAAFAEGVTTYSITAEMTAGEYKFRAGESWDYNLGGDMSGLTADGGNLSVAEAGSYEVVLSYNGEIYTSTATKQ